MKIPHQTGSAGKLNVEWIVHPSSYTEKSILNGQKTIHSIQTFQWNSFDGDSLYPFNYLSIRVYFQKVSNQNYKKNKNYQNAAQS